MSFEATALVLAWVAILVLALALSGLIRQVRAMSLRPRMVSLPSENTVGTTLSFNGSLISNGETSTTVLMFVTAGCKTCDARLGDLEKAADIESQNISIAAVFPHAANGTRRTRIKVLEHQEHVFDQMRIPVTPFGVVLSKDGVVTHAAPVGSSEALGQLLQAARGEI